MSRKLMFVALVFTVLVHYILFILLVASIPMLFIYEPWYVSIPVVVWLLNLMTLPVRCQLTTLENFLRKKLGLKTIKGFVSRWVYFRR